MPTAAPALATITQPIASHCAADSDWLSMTMPTRAATAGSRLMQIPNTRVGIRRSVSSSNRYGITDESSPIRRPAASTTGSSSARPALATAAGVTTSAATPIPTTRPAEPLNRLPTRAVSRM